MSNADIRGLFIWHELMTTDPKGAAAFYCGLFPWKTEPSSRPEYTLWMSGSTGVAGLMAQPEEVRRTGTPPSWLVYLGTADVDETVRAAQGLGGRVLKEPTDIPGTGRFAVLSDPQGAAFAVFTPAMPAPAGAAHPGGVAQFSWHELATTDPQSALDFYSELFGWSVGPVHDMGAGNAYHIIERGGVQIGGVYRLQDPSKAPCWLSYVKVESLDGTVSTARAAGGQVVQEPQEVPGGDRVARILDPQGGAVALHESRKSVASAVGTPALPARRNARPKASARRARTKAVKAKPVKAKAAKTKAAKAATRKSGRRGPAAAKRGARKAKSARTAAKARSAKTRIRAPKAAKKAAGKAKHKAGRRRR